MNFKKIEVFGLLHLAQSETSAVNLKTKSFEDQISTYLHNASLLMKSLKYQNIKFTLLTNNKNDLVNFALKRKMQLNIEQLECTLTIPTGIKFYSAHFKFDVFRYISKLKIDYAIFCDLDVVCLKPLPAVFDTYVDEQIPLVYEVTDQIIPGDGHEILIKDLKAISDIKSEGKWIGGEFLSGPPKFFEKLTSEIDQLLPNYFINIKDGTIASKGNDEVCTTAAIETMRRQHIYISEAGLSNIVGRFWSSGPGFVQRPFEYFEDTFLLHLPADKYFLERMDKKMEFFDPKLFIAEYKKMMNIKKLKGLHRSILYLLFRIKGKTIGLRSIKLKPNIEK